MLPPLNHSAEFQDRLINHGSDKEQIKALKDKLMFWRVVGVTLGLMFIVAAFRALSK